MDKDCKLLIHSYLGSTLSRAVYIDDDDEVNARITKASAAFEKTTWKCLGSKWDQANSELKVYKHVRPGQYTNA